MATIDEIKAKYCLDAFEKWSGKDKANAFRKFPKKYNVSVLCRFSNKPGWSAIEMKNVDGPNKADAMKNARELLKKQKNVVEIGKIQNCRLTAESEAALKKAGFDY